MNKIYFPNDSEKQEMFEALKALLKRDELKSCPFCSKDNWLEICPHDISCPFDMVYKIVGKTEGGKKSMKIPENELKEFEEILKKADWYFRRAEGEAYRRGRASVDNAVSMRFMLCKKYPESEKDVDELFVKYRPSRK